MIKLYSIISIASVSLLLQACNTGPDTPRPIAHTPHTIAKPQKPAADVSSRDAEYANLLSMLSQRDPVLEAQQAMIRGERNLLGYYAGRGGLKFPGLTPQQQANQRCTLKTLDGLGDVIYGENHLKYRVALRKFAKRYNIAMMPVCL